MVLAVAGAHPPAAGLALEPGVARAHPLGTIAGSPVGALGRGVGVVGASSFVRPRRPEGARHQAAVGPRPPRVAAALPRRGRAIGGGLARAVAAAEIRRAGLTNNNDDGLSDRPEPEESNKKRRRGRQR